MKHFGNGAPLLPIDDPWQTLEAGLAMFEQGFLLEREQPEHLTNNTAEFSRVPQFSPSP